MATVGAFTLSAQNANQDATPLYLDPSRPATERAHDLVGRMTLD